MSVSVTAHSLAEMVERYGEERLTKFLQTFSCPKNPEVERFLKDKAISSATLSASQTYVVTDDATGLIVGYYTLVLKAYTVNGSKLTSANRRLISRFAEADDLGNFHAAVYLIAQIGKNFAISEKKISGTELMGMALDEFRAIRRRVGGKIVMVEREDDRPKLLGFYNRNGFKSWTRRVNSKDGVVYDQMFAILSGE